MKFIFTSFLKKNYYIFKTNFEIQYTSICIYRYLLYKLQPLKQIQLFTHHIPLCNGALYIHIHVILYICIYTYCPSSCCTLPTHLQDIFVCVSRQKALLSFKHTHTCLIPCTLQLWFIIYFTGVFALSWISYFPPAFYL